MEAKVIPPPPDANEPTTGSAPAVLPPQLDPVGRFKEGLVGGVGGEQLATAEPGSPGQFMGAVQSAGQLLLPGSIPELAVMAALPFVGRLGGVVRGVGMARDVARAGVRTAGTVGAGTAAGAASASQRGETAAEGALRGAATGLVPSVVAEVFAGTGSVVEAAARRWGNLDTKGFAGKVRDVVGPITAKSITADIPSLAGKVSEDVPGILSLLDDTTGRKVLGQMFDKQEAAMAASMGRTQIAVPNEAIDLAKGIRGPAASQATAPAAGAVVGAVQGGVAPVTPMQPLDAIKLGKVLRTKGLNGKDPDARIYRQAADSVTDAVKARATPADAQAYTALQQDYRKFMGLRDFLGQNTDKLFPGMKSKSATMDLVVWGDRIVNDYASMNPTDFPRLHEVFSGPGAAGSGVRPTAGSIPVIGHARMGVPIPGMQHARLYESGRLPTTVLPEHLQSELSGRFKTRIEALGRGTAFAATPSAAPTQDQP